MRGNEYGQGGKVEERIGSSGKRGNLSQKVIPKKIIKYLFQV